MIVPIIVPHIASSGAGAAPTEASMAAVLAFGSVIGLKVLVCILIALIPVGAVGGWREEKGFGALMLSFMLPVTAFVVWFAVVAVIHALLWVVA